MSDGQDKPVGEHGEVVDDGRVEEADVVPAAPDVLVWTGSLATGALRLCVEVVVVGEALARVVVHPRDGHISADHLTTRAGLILIHFLNRLTHPA